MDKKIILLLLTLYSVFAFSQESILVLQEAEISTSRVPIVYNESGRIITLISQEEIALLPVSSIDELLNYVMSVDVRQRGAQGVQSDISIRGGSFEQFAILLNGVKVNDPQTGHHNLNIPLDLSCVKQIEILMGSGARIYGPNAFSGAINIITKAPNNHGMKVQTEFGDYNYRNINTSYYKKIGKLNHFVSAGNKYSSGYRHNTDFNISNFFWFADGYYKTGKIIMQAGYNDKKFGANSFYSPAYPEQYEQTRSFISSIRNETKGKLNLNTQLYYRRHQDRFELFRDYKNAAIWYNNHNYHVSHTYGIDVNSWFSWLGGKSAFGCDFRREIIFSNVLGELLNDTLPVLFEPNGFFIRSGNRNIYSFFADHVIYYNKFIFSAGAMIYLNSDISPQIFPGIDISYALSNNTSIIGSMSKTIRMPSYTELYYKSPNHLSNPNLKPEEAVSSEIGIKYINTGIQAGTAFFYRNSNNSIDWVRLSDSLLWQSSNITEIQSLGNEVFIKILPSTFTDNNPITLINTSFTYNIVQKSSEQYYSQYALDYLKYKANISLYHNIYKDLKAVWTCTHQHREGTYTSFPSKNEVSYKAFTTIDGKMYYDVNNFRFYIEASNIFNANYFDLGNIPMPGRWFKSGIIYSPTF